MSSKYVKVKISENILSTEMFKIVFGRTEATAIISVGTVTSFFFMNQFGTPCSITMCDRNDSPRCWFSSKDFLTRICTNYVGHCGDGFKKIVTKMK